MNIIVNGKPVSTEEGMLGSFIEKTRENPGRVIAELNQRVIKRDLWNTQPLCENDRLELIMIVGGG